MKRRRIWILAVAFSMCFILSTPFIAIAQDYPTTDGEPLFTLHIVTPRWVPIAYARAEYVAAALHDVGIECVIHEEWFADILMGLWNPEYYGIEEPGLAGPPHFIEVTTGPHFHHSTDYGGVMWCGENNPYSETPPGYGNKWDEKLTKPFELPMADEVSMSYSIWYDTEEDWDFVYVQISADGWNTYDTIMAYDGDSEGFITEDADLTAHAGQDVEIRFQFLSDLFFSDQDGNYDSNGACRIDWVKVADYEQDNFGSGNDEWVASTTPIDVLQGWDMVVGPSYTSAGGGYEIETLEAVTTDGRQSHGYSNPKYDAMYNKLESLGIDWNANFPDPPDLDEGGEALEQLEELQEIFIEDQPITILWCRHDLPWGAAVFPFIPYNFNNKDLAKRGVRQAISLSINRKEMMKATALAGWDLTVVQTPLPPWHPGFSNKFKPKYNPKQAIELLRDAGYS